MKLRKSFGRRKNLKLIFIRQVVGPSMAPRLQPGQIVVATNLLRRHRPGHVVIILHQGKEKVKRIERIEGAKAFVIGDNLNLSTDSRHFGWLDRNDIIGRVIWPNVSN